ncbi:MAG: group III truncated hemoglobin [Alphaproteobacteria bacterium]|nr:group III truncated hemoglobin [Alphaproteobacteria bacterium]
MKQNDINDETIKNLVDSFYSKVIDDKLIGPLFIKHIGAQLDDWEGHLKTMYRFWASVMNGTGQYKGNPHMVHGRFATEAHSNFFERWLDLWFQTVDELFEPETAQKFKKKAEMIAKSLHYTMFDAAMPDKYVPTEGLAQAS